VEKIDRRELYGEIEEQDKEGSLPLGPCTRDCFLFDMCEMKFWKDEVVA
jgi:hypothetical protein